MRPRSILHTSVEDIRGDRLTLDQLTDLIWFIVRDRMDRALKISIIVAGRDEWRRVATQTYGHHGLTQRHFDRIWRRLNRAHPEAARLTPTTHAH